MTFLVLGVIFAVLLFQLLGGNWRAGMITTVIIGFLQDPLRKLTPDQPSWMVALALLAFCLTAYTLYTKRRGRLSVDAIVWTMPTLGKWVPIYLTLIFLQAVNSFARFGSVMMSTTGIIFYLAPIVGLWVGFQVGCNQQLLRKLLIIYLCLSSIYAVTVFLSYHGYDDVIFQEVGEGIEIIFRWGFHAKGASGFWRTSEIAGWQLTAAACFSITLAFSLSKPESQISLLFLAACFTFLTILTARRKAIAMVVAYITIYLLLFSRRSDEASRERTVTSILGVAGISYFFITFFLADNMGPHFGEYVTRATSTTGDIGSRFSGQGIGAMLRAFEISNGIGLGAGVGSNTGGLEFGSAVGSIHGASYVAEGGGGRIVLELGIPGLIVLIAMGCMMVLLMVRNFKLLRYLPPGTANLYMGLLAFTISNVPFFYSAAQVYTDPFVLIMMSISMGSFLAIPTLVAQQQRDNQRTLQAQHHFLSHSKST